LHGEHIYTQYFLSPDPPPLQLKSR
jgi:hypothetical protein